MLFLDEIHRFNKAQQDFLLPYVESGQLILIGATTENPSFEVISAFFRDAKYLFLKSLLKLKWPRLSIELDLQIDQEAQEWLIQMANGDARQAISLLENTAKLYKEITVENLQKCIAKYSFAI